MHARELLQDFVLDRGRSGHSFGQRLHLSEPLAGFSGSRPARGEHFGQSLFLLRDCRLFLLHRDELRVHLFDLALQRRELSLQRQHLSLQRADGFQLLARVGDLDRHAVDLASQRVDFGAPGDLLLQVAVDVARHRREFVEPRFDAFDKLLLACDPGRPAVEVVRDRNESGRLLRAVLDDRQLAGDGVHARLELRQPRAERRRTVEKRFQRGPIARDPIAQLHRRGVGLVEVLELLPQ